MRIDFAEPKTAYSPSDDSNVPNLFKWMWSSRRPTVKRHQPSNSRVSTLIDSMHVLIKLRFYNHTSCIIISIRLFFYHSITWYSLNLVPYYDTNWPFRNEEKFHLVAFVIPTTTNVQEGFESIDLTAFCCHRCCYGTYWSPWFSLSASWNLHYCTTVFE